MIAGGASLAPRRWSFAGRGDAGAQQISVFEYRADRVDEEGQEHQVALRRAAGRRQVLARVRAKTPVVVLAGTVDAGVRLSCNRM